jgi:pimeloyl-ACP methyl ester carboxylesterase
VVEQRSIVVDGVRVSYWEQGRATAGVPSLVLLHGLIATAETYLPLMRCFAAEQHVIALDLPGSGASERLPGNDATLPAMADAVAKCLQRLQLEQPVLVGHSHGGAVAMQVVVRSPESVAGLVLISSAHPFSTHEYRLIRFYLSRTGTAFAYLLPWLPRRVQLAGFRRAAGSGSWIDPQQLEPYRANLQKPGLVAHLLRLLESWHADMDALGRSLADGLDVPALLLWGDRDRAVPASTAVALSERLTASRLEIFPDIGHQPAEEAPELCAQAIEVWLASL